MTHKEGLDYGRHFHRSLKKTFLALVAHFNSKLRQMDVKIAFLNRNLEEEIYIDQPEGFSSEGMENIVCKSKKSIRT